MREFYHDLRIAIAKNTNDEEEIDVSAALGAICSALVISRKTQHVTENVGNLMTVTAIFRCMMSVERLICKGVLEAEPNGIDEYGWPQYQLSNVDAEIIERLKGEITEDD